MASFPIDLTNRTHRDAARLAIQSAAAAALMFSLMKAFGMPERFVGVLSAVMVVQPTAGAAISEAKDRFLATIAGAIIGVACLALLPSGYGTAAALALSMLVMNAIAGFREEWRYGVVAAVALALGSDSDIWQTALDRSVAIGAGVVVGALVTLIIWPDKAEDRARRSLREAWQALADYLQNATKRTMGSDQSGNETAKAYRGHMKRARGAVDNVSMADTKHLQSGVDATQNAWSAARFLERIGEEVNAAGDGDLRDCTEKLSNTACGVLHALANGDRPDRSDLSDMNETMERAREHSVGGPGDSGLSQAARGALVFTLGELAEAVRELAHAADPDKAAT